MNQPLIFSILVILIIVLVLSLFVLYHWRQDDSKIVRLAIKRTDDEFKQAVLATGKKLKWKITRLNKNKAFAIDEVSNFEERYNEIRITRYSEYVEISSLPLFGVDWTSGNKRNIATFLRYYSLSNKGIDLEELSKTEDLNEQYRIDNEPEWSFSNTLKRILAYFTSLLFLGISYANYNYEGINLITLMFALLGSFYIVLDLIVLMQKYLEK